MGRQGPQLRREVRRQHPGCASGRSGDAVTLPGRTKRGSTRMVYKPEHVVDLETGAIVGADVRPGDEHDTADLAQRVLEVEARMNEGLGEPKDTESVELVAADKGT